MMQAAGLQPRPPWEDGLLSPPISPRRANSFRGRFPLRRFKKNRVALGLALAAAAFCALLLSAARDDADGTLGLVRRLAAREVVGVGTIVGLLAVDAEGHLCASAEQPARDARVEANPYYGVDGGLADGGIPRENMWASLIVTAAYSSSSENAFDVAGIRLDAGRTAGACESSTFARIEIIAQISRGCAVRSATFLIDRLASVPSSTYASFVDWAASAAVDLAEDDGASCSGADAAALQQNFERTTGPSAARGFLLASLRLGEAFAPTTLEKAAWMLRVHAAADYVAIMGSDHGLPPPAPSSSPDTAARAVHHLAAARSTLLLFRHRGPASSRRDLFDHVTSGGAATHCGPVEWAVRAHWRLGAGVSLNEPLWEPRPDALGDGGAGGLRSCLGPDGARTAHELIDALTRSMPGLVGEDRLARSLVSDDALRLFWTSVRLPRGDGQVDFESEISVSRAGGARNVLVLLPWLVIGGADRVALDILEGLTGPRYGWRATVLLSQHPPRGEGHAWLDRGRAATRRDDVFVMSGHVPTHIYAELVCYLVRTRAIDSILISNAAAPYMFLPIISRDCPVSAVVDLSHNWVDEWLDGSYTSFSIGMANFIDRSMYVSTALQRVMLKNGADPRIGRVIRVGVDLTLFTRTGPRPSVVAATAPVTVRVVFFGRLSGEKRPQLFVRAVAMARDLLLSASRTVTLEATIIGDGPEEPYTRETAHTLGLTATFTGALHGDALLAAVQAQDILLLTSQTEGTPLAAMEAMALGLAVVAPNVGGVAEVVCGGCGAVVTVDDVMTNTGTGGGGGGGGGGDRDKDDDEELTRRFAAALVRVAADPIALARMQREAEAFAAEELDLRKTVGAVAALFDEAAEDARHRRAGARLRHDLAGQGDVIDQLVRQACNSFMTLRTGLPL